jgi:hypothetical protein
VNLLVLVDRVVPDIPLVEREINRLFRALLGFDEIAGGDRGANEVVEFKRLRQKRGKIIPGFPMIGMQREILDMVICVLEHGRFPLWEVRHARM